MMKLLINTKKILVLSMSGILCIGILCIGIWSCTDDLEIGDADIYPPVITEMYPASGMEGDEIPITGRNFSTTAAENVVSFNGIAATVTAVNITDFSTHLTLTTTVPVGTTTGPVTVTVGNLTSDTVSFTITSLITLVVPITAELDDIEENIVNGQVNDTGSSDLELGEFDTSGTPDNGLQVIGLRYNGITIPAGATIQSASIQFMSESDGDLECQMTIYGENAGNSVVFDPAVAYTVAGRTKTTANAVWDIPAWIQDDVTDAQKTVDLASIIQEIVNRVDWVSGNSLSIIMVPTGISATATEKDQGREAATFDGDYAPELTIVYE